MGWCIPTSDTGHGLRDHCLHHHNLHHIIIRLSLPPQNLAMVIIIITISQSNYCFRPSPWSSAVLDWMGRLRYFQSRSNFAQALATYPQQSHPWCQSVNMSHPQYNTVLKTYHNQTSQSRTGQHFNHLGPGQHHKHYLSPGQLSCQNIMNFMLQDNISNMIYIQDNKVVKPHAPGQHLKPDDLYPGQPGSVRRHVAPRAHLLLPAGQCHQHPPLPK